MGIEVQSQARIASKMECRWLLRQLGVLDTLTAWQGCPCKQQEQQHRRKPLAQGLGLFQLHLHPMRGDKRIMQAGGAGELYDSPIPRKQG